MSSIDPAFSFASIQFVIETGKQMIWGFIFWQGHWVFLLDVVWRKIRLFAKQMSMWQGWIDW